MNKDMDEHGKKGDGNKGDKDMINIYINEIKKDIGSDKIMNCLTNARNIIQKTIREKQLTDEQIKKSFGIKKYEK